MATMTSLPSNVRSRRRTPLRAREPSRAEPRERDVPPSQPPPPPPVGSSSPPAFAACLAAPAGVPPPPPPPPTPETSGRAPEAAGTIPPPSRLNEFFPYCWASIWMRQEKIEQVIINKPPLDT
ncbi:uncharacterized protein PHA67_015103 [Liasis olivaceus]